LYVNPPLGKIAPDQRAVTCRRGAMAPGPRNRDVDDLAGPQPAVAMRKRLRAIA
jgi:hypothetical protein